MKPENMKNEAHVKATVKKLLEDAGAWYFMPVPVGYGRHGIPDFIACLNGRFLAIETKFAQRLLTAHQQREITALRHAGGTALVVNQWDLDLLRETLEKLA